MSSRLTSLFAAAALGLASACPCFSQEDPGMIKPPPIEETESPIEKIDASRVVSDLTMPLKFSSRQEERVKSALQDVEKEFGKLEKEHQAAREEARKWRYKINDLRHEMLKLTKTIPDAIRPLLDPEQREKFDAMIEQAQEAKRREQQVSQEPPAGDIPPGQPVRRKRRVKRPVSGQPAAQEPSLQEQGVVTEGPVQETQPVRRRKKIRKPVLEQSQPETPVPPGSEPTGRQMPPQGEGTEEIPSGSYP